MTADPCLLMSVYHLKLSHLHGFDPNIFSHFHQHQWCLTSLTRPQSNGWSTVSRGWVLERVTGCHRPGEFSQLAPRWFSEEERLKVCVFVCVCTPGGFPWPPLVNSSSPPTWLSAGRGERSPTLSTSCSSTLLQVKSHRVHSPPETSAFTQINTCVDIFMLQKRKCTTIQTFKNYKLRLPCDVI